MKKADKRALFSVDKLDNIAMFTDALKGMGWHIIATSETVEKLKRHDIEIENVSHFIGVKEDYGFPPTLHPKIEAALTTDVPFKIDLVYDVPYPLSKGNDVGGHTLLALGTKGNRIVVFLSEDMKEVIEELKKSPDHITIPDSYRQQLIDKANSHIAEHYISLARRNGENLFDGLSGRSILRLLNGENPYQVPSDLFVTETQDCLSLSHLQLKGASLPCFTNVADTDCILQTLCLAAEAFRMRYKRVPYIAVAAKHGNACGMGVDWIAPENAVFKALFGNPEAIWGGEFIVNFKINEDIARILYKSEKRKEKFGNASWMLDVIVAPVFNDKAIEILGKRSNRKLFENTALYEPRLPTSPLWHYRQIRGGFLRQPAANYIFDITKTEHSNLNLDAQTIDELILAWSVAYSSNHGGNEVVLVKDNQLIGAGGGPSTVEAARIAVLRAEQNGHDSTNSVFAADAFFAFTDAPEILKGAGCIAGIVPSGGNNELLVREYFLKNKISMIYIPPQYRGFCRH